MRLLDLLRVGNQKCEPRSDRKIYISCNYNYKCMKTIALRDITFRLLKDLKGEKNVRSFDKMVFNLVVDKKKVPKTMFGILRGKSKPFTRRERNKIWEDVERE